jgi:hypothetical protein
MSTTTKPLTLGTRIKASGYMVRYSTMKRWRERNPEAGYGDGPHHGFKTWKRNRTPFAGVYVGKRVLTIKEWWWRDLDTGDLDWGSRRFPITFWLIAYSTRAKLRYVLPRDVEATP